MGKSWYKSRTVWVNIIAIGLGAIAGIAQAIAGRPVIDPGIQGVIATTLLAVINLALRKITGEPLT